MLDLGIDPARIEMPDYVHGIRHAAFHPHGMESGNISPDGRMIVDSGLFNADLLKAEYGRKAGKLFDGSRLRDRLDSILAHEYEEQRHGMSHEQALKAAPKTALPISHRARRIYRSSLNRPRSRSKAGLGE